MDPTATLALLRHPTTDPDTRYDAAIDLAAWLARGGFVPDGETRDGLLDELAGIIVGYTPAETAADAHLEAAFEDTVSGEDW